MQVAALHMQYPSLVSCAYMAFLSDAAVDIPTQPPGSQDEGAVAAIGPAGSQGDAVVAAVGPAGSQGDGADASAETHIPKCVFQCRRCCANVVTVPSLQTRELPLDIKSWTSSLSLHLPQQLRIAATQLSRADGAPFHPGSRSSSS